MEIPPRGRAAGELEELLKMVLQVRLDHDKEDGWAWKLSVNEVFSVKDTYQFMRTRHNVLQQVLSTTGQKFHWNSLIPIKVSLVVWRASMDKLPVKVNVAKRGVVVSDKVCVLCKGKDEESSHIFFECTKVVGIWRKVFAWWGIPFPNPLDWKILYQDGNACCKTKELNKVFHGVLYIVIWAIWFWRNKIAFAKDDEAKKWESEDLFPIIQKKSLFWFESKGRNNLCNWATWITSPWMLDSG